LVLDDHLAENIIFMVIQYINYLLLLLFMLLVNSQLGKAQYYMINYSEQVFHINSYLFQLPLV